MIENRIFTFTLEDISKIVAEKIKVEKGLSLYTGLKIKFDEQGQIYFEIG